MTVPFRAEFKFVTVERLAEIERVPLLFASDSAKSRAADALVKGCRDAYDRLLEIDFVAASRGARDLIALFQANKGVAGRRMPELARELRWLGWQCCQYETLHFFFLENYYTLRALQAWAHRLTRDELRASMLGESWATQHEVLARWGWVRMHGEDQRYASHPLPFRCLVALPHEGKHRGELFKEDREFAALIDFGHGLRGMTGRELLLKQGNRETPDFEVEDVQGQCLGIEICEALLENYGVERHSGSAVMQQLGKLGSGIAIEEPDSWWELLNTSAFKTLTLPSGQDLTEPLCSIRAAKVENTAAGTVIVRGRGPKPAIPEREVAEVILRQIERKARGSRPQVQPCLLLVNPVLDSGVRPDILLDVFDQELSLDCSTHFQEVWLGTDALTVQIWPRAQQVQATQPASAICEPLV